MLKNIATVRSEYTRKYVNMVSYNTNYVFPDLIYFFGDIEKQLESRLKKKEMFVSEKSIILTKN